MFGIQRKQNFIKKFGSLHYPVINSVKPKPTEEFNIISSLMKMIRKLII